MLVGKKHQLAAEGQIRPAEGQHRIPWQWGREPNRLNDGGRAVHTGFFEPLRGDLRRLLRQQGLFQLHPAQQPLVFQCRHSLADGGGQLAFAVGLQQIIPHAQLHGPPGIFENFVSRYNDTGHGNGLQLFRPFDQPQPGQRVHLNVGDEHGNGFSGQNLQRFLAAVGRPDAVAGADDFSKSADGAVADGRFVVHNQIIHGVSPLSNGMVS